MSKESYRFMFFKSETPAGIADLAASAASDAKEGNA